MQSPDKLTLLWFALVLAGIVLSLFFGVGWLFLAVTIRRAVMVVPPLRRWVRGSLGLPSEPLHEDSQAAQIARTLGYVTLVAWIGLTVFAFLTLNVPVIEMFGG